LLIDTRRKIHNAAYKKINSKLEDGDKKWIYLKLWWK
jgi:hypothetical protein